MLRTLVPAAAAATLTLLAPSAHAAPAWAGADAVVLQDLTLIVGEAACTAAAADVAGLRYADVTVHATEMRNAYLEVGCTLWAGAVPVLEVVTSGTGAAAASANQVVTAMPDRACVWGWWLVETFVFGEFGNRYC